MVRVGDKARIRVPIKNTGPIWVDAVVTHCSPVTKFGKKDTQINFEYKWNGWTQTILGFLNADKNLINWENKWGRITV